MDNVNNFLEKYYFSTFFRISNVDKLKTSFFSLSTDFYILKHFCAFCIFAYNNLPNPALMQAERIVRKKTVLLYLKYSSLFSLI